MAKAFTDSFVSTLRPGKGQQGWRELADGGCRGLHLKVSQRGEKVWAVRHMVGGKRRRHLIGAYPAVSLAEARSRARQYLAAAREGQSGEEVDARHRAMSLTVAAAHQEYIEAVGPTLRESTLSLKRGMLRLHINPAIGSLLVKTLRKGDVIALIERVRREAPVQANRVYSEVMALLRWCEQKGYVEGIPSVPKRAVATQEQPRRRTLTDVEIGQLWATAQSVGPLTCDFIRLLLLTGQRSSEVRKMTWDEIKLEEGLWIIPGARYKTGVDHVVPLSPAVVDILLRRWTVGAKGYVLANRRTGRPFNGAASAMRRLRKHLGASADFTPHDLRRTVRTGMARLGVSDLTAEMVIGHQLQGIQRVYDRHDRLEQRREALCRWAEHVGSLVGIATEAGAANSLAA